MQYEVRARRLDATGSRAESHRADVRLATDTAGRTDARNPVELLLSALAASLPKGAEHMLPVLEFRLDGMEVTLVADRQDAPPKLTAIRHEIVVDSRESDARLDLLHRNILEYGTISNTLSAAVPLSGTLRRA